MIDFSMVCPCGALRSQLVFVLTLYQYNCIIVALAYFQFHGSIWSTFLEDGFAMKQSSYFRVSWCWCKIQKHAVEVSCPPPSSYSFQLVPKGWCYLISVITEWQLFALSYHSVHTELHFESLQVHPLNSHIPDYSKCCNTSGTWLSLIPPLCHLSICVFHICFSTLLHVLPCFDWHSAY